MSAYYIILRMCLLECVCLWVRYRSWLDYRDMIAVRDGIAFSMITRRSALKRPSLVARGHQDRTLELCQLVCKSNQLPSRISNFGFRSRRLQIFNQKGIGNHNFITVIPRLTKIIRSGFTFVSRNVISRRFLQKIV